MAIQFQSLKLKDQDLFGISLKGSVSRSDKTALLELATQAMSRQKVKLVMDLGGLTSLGGSGARVLADFQRQLIAAEGEAVFAGVQSVVRHFLEGPFEDLPLRYFLTVDDAVKNFNNQEYCEPDYSAMISEPKETPVEEMDEVEESEARDDDIGAMSFHDDDGSSDSELDGLLGEFTGKEARKGRRKEYHYTSLSEAVEALGTWHNGENRAEFAQALTNLLFSQGLAESVNLLFPSGIHLRNVDGDQKLPLAGSLARQLVEFARPLTFLDLRDDELVDSEIKFLEETTPEMILPLLQDRQLIGVIMLGNDGKDREYTVGENFAFELLMKVLSGTVDEEPVVEEKAEDLVEAAQSLSAPLESSATSDLNGTLYQLAMELPEADDRPHFWRIFHRHLNAVHTTNGLAFLAPESIRPQFMAGHDNNWMALDLGQDRLRLFFRSLERPVRVENLPSLFQDEKDKMLKAGVKWLVAMNWEQEYLGLVLMNCNLEGIEMSPEERLMQLFDPTVRLLARFEGRNEHADVTRELVQVLMAEREVRCFGDDTVTTEMVRQLNLLAKEMSFPPDQHRDLIYGCLLRDLGQVGQGDELMVAPTQMTPEQLQVYYKHPERGRDLLKSMEVPSTIVEVIASHHERFSGQGYPEGLVGRDIPLAARIVTVVENYVAMISGIGFPEPLQPEAAAQLLREDDEGRFDPDIVSVFLQAVLANNSELDSAGSKNGKKEEELLT